ncbi:MAG: nitroreductase [Acidobacteria bacterium]|nr:MAG: nitroreductase [Acidobacteriota bacterium]
MHFSELLTCRYSVRAYRPDPVPQELLEKVLFAARMAPTAANRQPFQVIVIHTAGRENDLKHIYHREWFRQAPLTLCVCGLPDKAWVRGDGWNSYETDASIVMDHMLLAAADLGLGTCWIANFSPAAAREVLRLPEGVTPLAFTPLGFPADQPSPKERKPLAELVRYEGW